MLGLVVFFVVVAILTPWRKRKPRLNPLDVILKIMEQLTAVEND